MAKMHFKTCFKAFKAPFKDINDEIVQLSVEIEQKCAKGAKIYQQGVKDIQANHECYKTLFFELIFVAFLFA